MKRLRPMRRQGGVALILVMWVVALMAVLLGSFALIARTENLESRHMFDTTAARYDAIAGVELALFQLRNPDPLQRWVADGRPYEFPYEGAIVHVEVTNESGKIDLNVADSPTLMALFQSVGVDLGAAEALSDAIQDWRDADSQVRPHGAEAPQYAAAGLDYGPTNLPFQTVSEVQQVLGMTYDLFKKIEPAITVYSGTRTPNPAFAPYEALMAIPGMTPQLAQQIIAARQAAPPGTTGAIQGLTLPGGGGVMASGGGLTYSIKSKATLQNGVNIMFDTTIRIGGVSSSGRPYTILRWRDGEAS
ncbi:MAG: general secretion pathway protein GspK [Rudaea sp.]|uniref:general secretion pathway protein GspK n=1 Tax=unclassified Rudaea TaxID=2627037 RepID=UPI001484E9E7|nr:MULTISPECIES: general secretion pathway protein GspK [unclassified Rudaea]MBN8885882.1 general secretion pathway protein GspK [Rudaea sp.]MBR0343778.1 general secretion pathway protein GspK [Rudaea sp.]